MAPLADMAVRVRPDFTGFPAQLSRGLQGQTRTAATHGAKQGRVFGGAYARATAGPFRAIGGIFTKSIGGIGVALGAVAGIRAFKGFIADARESAKVGRLTESTIRATGGAAKVTARQVGDLATALSNKTGKDDEAIQSGQNMLLTFKNIRNETGKGNRIFDQASAVLIDMTAAMNNGVVTQTNMSKQAIALGKALNDPIAGMGALRRVGVTFTDQQKEQITALVKSGRTMDAQKIILRELASEFGGAAKASSDPMERLQVIVGNLGEKIGTALLPYIDRFATWVGDRAVPAISSFIDGMQSGQGAGGQFASSVKTIVSNIRSMVEWAIRNRDVLIPLVGTVLTFAVTLRTVTKTVGLVNAALRLMGVSSTIALGPIGLIIAAVAGVAVGLVILYKRSKTFRDIVNGVFRAVALGSLAFAKVMLTGAKMIFDGLFTFVLAPLRTLLAVMSKLPFGMGKPFKAAAKTLDGFKSSADKAFNAAIGKVDDWSDTLRKAPKVAKLKGEISDLDAKIRSAKRKLKDPHLTRPEKTKLRADIKQLLDQKRRAQQAVDRLHGKTVSVKMTMKNKLKILAAVRGVALTIVGKPIDLFAAGGPVRRVRGLIRGVGGPTQDNIPLMGSVGEYVIKAASAKKIGTPVLDALNKVGDVAGDVANMALAPGAGTVKMATGGSVSKARDLVFNQRNDPYIWGGVGPYGFDCSGLVGLPYAALMGLPLFRRYFTTASSFPPIGWKRGKGAFTMGVNPGVHMAGNIGGLPFEAASTRLGIRVGHKATPVTAFPQQWYLASIGGAFGSLGSVGFTPRELLNNVGLKYSMRNTPARRFDDGGWLPPRSVGTWVNGTDTWEPVGKGAGTTRVVIDVTGADTDLKRLVRKWFRKGGGDVR